MTPTVENTSVPSWLGRAIRRFIDWFCGGATVTG
jgi:hypothetical protein